MKPHNILIPCCSPVSEVQAQRLLKADVFHEQQSRDQAVLLALHARPHTQGYAKDDHTNAYHHTGTLSLVRWAKKRFSGKRKSIQRLNLAQNVFGFRGPAGPARPREKQSQQESTTQPQNADAARRLCRKPQHAPRQRGCQFSSFHT